jgi:hypothetical protein
MIKTKPTISLQELYRMKKQKEANKKICYDKVLERCHARIRNAAQYGGMNTFYEIPAMIVGLPLFSIQLCTEYVMQKLRENGFLVQLLPPPSVYVIYISWDPQELKQTSSSQLPTLDSPSTSVEVKRKLRLF